MASTIGANLLYGLLMSGRIDNWGHLGGLAGGFAAAYLLGPMYVARRGGLRDEPPLSILAGKRS